MRIVYKFAFFLVLWCGFSALLIAEDLEAPWLFVLLAEDEEAPGLSMLAEDVEAPSMLALAEDVEAPPGLMEDEEAPSRSKGWISSIIQE